MKESEILMARAAAGASMSAQMQRQANDLAGILRQETISKIAAMGPDALAVASHWTQWAKRMKALEAAGKLLPAIEAEATSWKAAREYEEQNSWMGGIETRQLYGIDLTSPPPAA